RRFVERARLELAAAFVVERDDGLVLLSDDGDEIGTPVAVEIDDGDVDRAGAAIDRLLLETRLHALFGDVLEIEDLADATPSEDRRDEIEIAVAVEIGGADVRDAAEPLGDRPLLEDELARLPQPFDRSVRRIGRSDRAEIRDEDVSKSIFIEVDHEGPGRMGDVAHAQEPPNADGRNHVDEKHLAIAHVADEELARTL